MPSVKSPKAKVRARREPILGAVPPRLRRKAVPRKGGRPWKTRTYSTSETEHLGRVAGRAARGGEIFALSGELGAGKTCFVRGLAAGLGASSLEVHSPTFVFVHEYSGRLRLAHADLFRLESASACHTLGLADYLNEGTILAVEWAEKAESELPVDCLGVELSHRGPHVRDIRFQTYGPSSAAFLIRFRKLAQRLARASRVAPTMQRTPGLGSRQRKT